MPPGPSMRSALSHLNLSTSTKYVCQRCRHASTVAAVTPAASQQQVKQDPRTIARHPPTQPPSFKPAEFRKTQLHRQYQSMLRSTPLILIFQHNNLKSMEWMAIKQELVLALRRVDEELAKNGDMSYIGASSRLQVVQTGIFASALKVVEFWEPKYEEDGGAPNGLSKAAWLSASEKGKAHGLEALLSGPIATFAIPSVSPQHVKAALSVLAPSKAIPAPKRKTNPGYYTLPVQSGIPKLMLLGARVDGRPFDFEGVRWIAGIQGGLGGLQAQLVHLLQSAGSSLTTTLDSAARNLYMTVESRRTMLEEDKKEETT